MAPLTISRKVYFSSGVSSEESTLGEGHNYCLEAFVEGQIDKTSGLVVNLIDVDKILKNYVLPLDHQHLNHDFKRFGETPVTPGQIAADAFANISPPLAKYHNIKLLSIRVTQGDNIFAEFHG